MAAVVAKVARRIIVGGGDINYDDNDDDMCKHGVTMWIYYLTKA